MSFFSFLPFGHGRSRKSRARPSAAKTAARKTLPLEVETLEDRCTPTVAGIQTVTQTLSFPPNGVAELTNWSMQQSVTQFSPSLGTLQSVVITNQGSVTAGPITAQNTSPSSSETITATVSGKLNLTGPTGVAIAANPNIQDGQPVTVGPSGSTSFPQATASDTESQTLTGTAMAAFIGSGSVGLTETAKGSSSASGDNGNLSASTTNEAVATVTVSYNYLPPASLSGYVYWDMGKDGPGTAGYNDGTF
jgi:hypothetical protein